MSTDREKLRSKLREKKEEREKKSSNTTKDSKNYTHSQRGEKVAGFRKQREYGEKKRIKP
jgi:hypothetical protein